MRAILLVLLAGCFDVVPPKYQGTVWECSGVFHCDGNSYGLGPSRGCSPSGEMALAEYTLSVYKLTEGAECLRKHSDVACVDTEEWCRRN